MNLTPEQLELREKWLALSTDADKCTHHFHGPGFVRVGLGDCQCGYKFDKHATKNFGKEAVKHHRHNFTCCKCHTDIECGLPFGEKKTDECQAIWDAYRAFISTLPPLGG
jgi:hypothetical protein